MLLLSWFQVCLLVDKAWILEYFLVGLREGARKGEEGGQLKLTPCVRALTMAAAAAAAARWRRRLLASQITTKYHPTPTAPSARHLSPSSLSFQVPPQQHHHLTISRFLDISISCFSPPPLPLYIFVFHASVIIIQEGR